MKIFVFIERSGQEHNFDDCWDEFKKECYNILKKAKKLTITEKLQNINITESEWT